MRTSIMVDFFFLDTFNIYSLREFDRYIVSSLCHDSFQSEKLTVSVWILEKKKI